MGLQSPRGHEHAQRHNRPKNHREQYQPVSDPDKPMLAIGRVPLAARPKAFRSCQRTRPLWVS